MKICNRSFIATPIRIIASILMKQNNTRPGSTTVDVNRNTTVANSLACLQIQYHESVQFLLVELKLCKQTKACENTIVMYFVI